MIRKPTYSSLKEMRSMAYAEARMDLSSNRYMSNIIDGEYISMRKPKKPELDLDRFTTVIEDAVTFDGSVADVVTEITEKYKPHYIIEPYWVGYDGGDMYRVVDVDREAAKKYLAKQLKVYKQDLKAYKAYQLAKKKKQYEKLKEELAGNT
jgi:hypothetical protein